MMENCQINNKCLITALLAALFIFMIAVFFSTVIDIKDKIQTSENTITVSDKGTVYAKPDLGIITASVVIEAKTVAEAVSENAEKMNAVISAMKEQGVEEKDLKTTYFNISPRYEWYDENEYYPSGKRVLVGYEVAQSLQVKIRDLTKIGEILQAATDVGVNEISDLELAIDNQDELRKQAREEAIAKAKTKAEELAKQLGIRLVGIKSFSESSVLPYFFETKEEALPSGMGGGETPQIETGENKIEVTVYITYEIK